MTYHQRAWHRGVYTHFHTPVVLLPCSGSVSRCGGHPVTIQWYLWVDVYPSTKYMWSCLPFCQQRHPHPLHMAQELHPSLVDALADIHWRSHSFLFIHPREVFLAWCWVITRPSSSCGIVLLSLPLGVGFTEVGLVHLSHTWQDTHMHRGMSSFWCTMRRSHWLQCRTCMNSHAGLSVHMRGHLLWSGFNPMATISSHSTISVFEPLS